MIYIVIINVRTAKSAGHLGNTVLYQHFLELDRRVKCAANRDEVCLLMMTVPGVGPIAALTFKAAVDDPSRFIRSRTVAAHFGLTPRRYQSGEHDNPGRISKAGDRDVRATLYAAGNALLMRTMAGSQIKSWGMRLMRTKGRRRAVVAVARKLAVLLHRMRADGTEFRPAEVEGTARSDPPHIKSNGIVPHRTRSGRSRKWLLRNEKRVSEQGSPLPIRHMRAAMPDGINQTAKRSVTRMSDNDPRKRRKTSLIQKPN